jgi:hypothetical protein
MQDSGNPLVDEFALTFEESSAHAQDDQTDRRTAVRNQRRGAARCIRAREMPGNVPPGRQAPDRLLEPMRQTREQDCRAASGTLLTPANDLPSIAGNEQEANRRPHNVICRACDITF